MRKEDKGGGIMERLTIDEVIEHCNKTCDMTEKIANVRGHKLESVESKQFWEHYQVRAWLKELKQYKNLEEQGLLLLLPVKAGDTVYRYVKEKSCVLEYTVWNISMSAYESGGIDIVIEGCAESEDEVDDEFSLSLIDFKNEFFNTKAEAEQKLNEMESK